jgi:hypothetical protein
VKSALVGHGSLLIGCGNLKDTPDLLLFGQLEINDTRNYYSEGPTSIVKYFVILGVPSSYGNVISVVGMTFYLSKAKGGLIFGKSISSHNGW